MKLKSILAIGTLALAGIASAKSYDIMLSSTTKVGNVQLAAGEYSMKVNGSNAVFTNVENGKSVSVAVKAKTGDKKFSETAVDTTNQNGQDQIQQIELGGSNTILQVGD